MTPDNKENKGKRIAYWIATGLLVAGMVGGGFAQFIQAKYNVDGFIHLGYPLYTMKIIGAWKMAGGIILFIPGYLLVKEWAYAGFFFLLTGAVVSHLAAGDTFYQWLPSFTFALLTVLSWYLRPAERKLLVIRQLGIAWLFIYLNY